jgi:hypothetical protein
MPRGKHKSRNKNRSKTMSDNFPRESIKTISDSSPGELIKIESPDSPRESMRKVIIDVRRGELKLCNQVLRFRCKDPKLIISTYLDNDIYLIIYSVKDTPYFYLEDVVKCSTMAADLPFTAIKIYEVIRDTKRKELRKHIIDELSEEKSERIFNDKELEEFANELDISYATLDESIFTKIVNLLINLKENANGILDLERLHIESKSFINEYINI